jgi:hypothetical protein
MENQDKSKFNVHLRERTIQMVRLFNAIKSKMKIKMGGEKCEI